MTENLDLPHTVCSPPARLSQRKMDVGTAMERLLVQEIDSIDDLTTLLVSPPTSLLRVLRRSLPLAGATPSPFAPENQAAVCST